MLPEPHHYAVCAYDDIPIKEFYKGYYEDIYICLHPFVKKNINSNRNLPKEMNVMSKNIMVSEYTKISWNEFCKYPGIDSLDKLDVALRSMIGGLNEKYVRMDLVEILEKKLIEHKIIIPDEGSMSKIIFNDLLNSLKDFYHKWVWIGDEFCTERKLYFIDDLIKDDKVPTLMRSMFTYNHEILFATHWDSFFTLLCGNKEYIDYSISKYNFEGFYCNDKTQIYWSLNS
jgi:hypothetical protein